LEIAIASYAWRDLPLFFTALTAVLCSHHTTNTPKTKTGDLGLPPPYMVLGMEIIELFQQPCAYQ